MRYVDLGAVNALNAKTKQDEREKRKSVRKALLIFGCAASLLFFAGVAKAVSKGGLASLLHPVSIVASFVNNTSLASTDGRINILILGLDRRGDSGTGLTDTVLVASVDRNGKNAVMISIPRDLWVKSPSNTYSKINEVYPISGLEDSRKTIENVLGVPIHYYAVIDFSAFEKAAEVLGGIDVNVENSFEDYEYPIAGMEASSCGRSDSEVQKMLDAETAYPLIWPCRYKKLSFQTGLQHMDGVTALEYARSRHGNNNEGTDFARAKRQQKVIMAFRDKALSLDTLSNPVKIKELYDTYNTYVATNIGIAEAQRFYELSSKAGMSSIKSVVLDDREGNGESSLLYEPEDKSLYRNAYVLIPKTGVDNYSQIHAYVTNLLFGEN